MKERVNLAQRINRKRVDLERIQEKLHIDIHVPEICHIFLYRTKLQIIEPLAAVLHNNITENIHNKRGWQ